MIDSLVCFKTDQIKHEINIFIFSIQSKLYIVKSDETLNLGYEVF